MAAELGRPDRPLSPDAPWGSASPSRRAPSFPGAGGSPRPAQPPPCHCGQSQLPHRAAPAHFRHSQRLDTWGPGCWPPLVPSRDQALAVPCAVRSDANELPRLAFLYRAKASVSQACCPRLSSPCFWTTQGKSSSPSPQRCRPPTPRVGSRASADLCPRPRRPPAACACESLQRSRPPRQDFG